MNPGSRPGAIDLRREFVELVGCVAGAFPGIFAGNLATVPAEDATHQRVAMGGVGAGDRSDKCPSRFTDPIPPRNVWTLVLTFGLDILVAAFMPWLLLANRVPVRRLIPGGVVFALAMLVARPASEAYLPRALEESADQYGSIGVAFTYLDAGRQVPTATAMPRPSMVKPVAACMKR